MCGVSSGFALQLRRASPWRASAGCAFRVAPFGCARDVRVKPRALTSCNAARAQPAFGGGKPTGAEATGGGLGQHNLSLCGEQKTLDRMQHMLMNNKPLRN
jgi:hypothetical protein